MTGVDLGVEEPWELPEGWAWSRIDHVTEKVATIDPRQSLTDDTFDYVDLGAIGPTGLIEPTRLLGRDAPTRARQLISPGDTLYSCVRVYLGNIVFFASGIENSVASTAFCVLRPTEAIDPRFLHHFVRSDRFRQWMIPLQRGNSPPAVVDSDVKSQPLPLPPLAEQRRIVARIDALFAEIAEGEAALARARAALETFRRALLKAAVTGELTREWREREADRDGAGSELMRIRAERAMASGSRRRGRKGAVTEPIVPTDLPDLPKGWLWASLDDMLLGIEAGLNVSAEGRPPRPDEIGIVKISAVTWGEFDETASKTLPPDFEFDERNEIRVGDFLFSRANTLELVGAPVIVEAIGRRLLLSDKVLRFRLATGCDRWVELVLKSSLGRRQIEALATGAQLSMRNISQDSIRSISIPLPPPAETAEILRRVSDTLAAQADTLALLDAEAADAARLRQSVLKAAFEGRLVPQDPTDEPARAMLERLAAKPAAIAPRRRGRPKRTER